VKLNGGWSIITVNEVCAVVTVDGVWIEKWRLLECYAVWLL
jgi:hypothetical protein